MRPDDLLTDSSADLSARDSKLDPRLVSPSHNKLVSGKDKQVASLMREIDGAAKHKRAGGEG